MDRFEQTGKNNKDLEYNKEALLIAPAAMNDS